RLGGKVEHSTHREYGAGTLRVDSKCRLFHGLNKLLDVWNSHGDRITKLPKGFKVVGTTEGSPAAAIEDAKRNFFGLQFHPEVAHTPRGKDILQNFLFKVCDCSMDWTMGSFIETTCEQIRA